MVRWYAWLAGLVSEASAKESCKKKLEVISQASNLDMYITAPDGYITVLVKTGEKEQILNQAENFYDLLEKLEAIQVYIAIMQQMSCKGKKHEAEYEIL